MHILIAAIGKAGVSEETLISGYLKRLTGKVDLLINDGRKLRNKAEETAWLLQQTADVEALIALDEQGKELTSMQFARQLEKWQESGISTIGFLIGGADGLDKAQLPRKTQLLCFGRMTWPHILARVMLAEQLYRAESILKGHPYHRP